VQLTPGANVRTALRAAACLLLATAAPTLARAETPAAEGWQLDGTGLVYAERQRTNVVEPIGKITRFFTNGQTLSAQFAVDAMTGATPTGARPTSSTQTVTSASGSSTHTVNEVPTHNFKDLRNAGQLEWGLPIGTLFNAGSSVRFSKERDYQSFGANETVSLDVLRRLATLTVGGGYDRDEVFPVGGTAAPLVDPSEPRAPGRNDKRVKSGLIGLSRVVSRRLLVGGNFTLTRESGYLTEPYKVISLIDLATDLPTGQVTESRPATRDRRAALVSAVYHSDPNVLYLEYRYYWDDWKLSSNTLDARYLVMLPGGNQVTPHVRLYTQKAAEFYTPKLDANAPIPEFASADYRLGPLDGLTVGATYTFRMPGQNGEWSIRAEYLRQWGRGPHWNQGDTGGGETPGRTAIAQPAAIAAGPPNPLDTIPALDIGTVVVGYSIHF
jgi:uncharacterized protein DUF3570